MMKSQRNIVFLALFHLMVLLWPLVAKPLHHHTIGKHHISSFHGRAISAHDRRCLICEFEFVSFIQPHLINTSVRFTPIVVKNPILVCPEIQVVHSLSQLRAPPVC